jgi:hypothetical protein
MSSRLELTALFAVLAATWLVPGTAKACHDITICLHWVVQSVDSGFGEDFGVGDSVPARGGRVSIIPPPLEHPREVYLDEQGCHTFESDYVTGFKIVAYSDALLGANRNVRIRAYEEPSDLGADIRYAEVLDLNNVTPESIVDLTTEYRPAFNLLAWAVHVVWQIDSQTMPRLSGPHSMRIFRDTESKGGDFDVRIRGPSQADPYAEGGIVRKFLIGHEVGHWLQQQWQVDDLLGWDYSYPVVDPNCEFVALTGSSEHGIRSAEWSSGALIEGIAHFFSSSAFNDITTEDASFVYYKEIDTNAVPAYVDFVTDGSIVTLGANQNPQYGGPLQWVQTMCPDDWAEMGGDVTSAWAPDPRCGRCYV